MGESLHGFVVAGLCFQDTSSTRDSGWPHTAAFSGLKVPDECVPCQRRTASELWPVLYCAGEGVLSDYYSLLVFHQRPPEKHHSISSPAGPSGASFQHQFQGGTDSKQEGKYIEEVCLNYWQTQTQSCPHSRPLPLVHLKNNNDEIIGNKISGNKEHFIECQVKYSVSSFGKHNNTLSV